MIDKRAWRLGRLSDWRRSRGSSAAGPILAALLLLPLLVPRAAAAAISAGPTVDVPWMKDVHGFKDVSAAVLADGSFATVATLIFQITGQDFEVHLAAQFFDAKGRAVTRPLTLIRPPAPVSYAGVGSVGTRYFLVWETYQQAYAAFYSAHGTLLDQPFRWPFSDILEFASYYRFGAAPRWRFLPITIPPPPPGSPNDSGARFLLRAAQPSGQLLGQPFELMPAGVAIEDAAINGSGRFVVVSRQTTFSQSSPLIRGMQIFDDAVKPLTPLLTAAVPQIYDSAGNFVNSIGSEVAMDPQGRVLLLWGTDLEESAGTIAVRLYDRQGAPLSDEIHIVSAVPNLVAVGVKALDDGSYVASWLTYLGPVSTGRLFLEHFNLQTGVFDEPIVVADGPIVGALMELNDAGKGVVVWQTVRTTPQGQIIEDEGHLRTIKVTK